MVALRTTTPPARTLGSSFARPSGCIASTPQNSGTMGGDTIASSASTTVDSLEPPRIMPMKMPNIIT
jgi:hypothetical protein